MQVFYQFRNDEAAGLGVPLPAGTVRVYQADSKGGVQFAGEDHIDHTPKDEDVTIKIGSAFDVVCERKQVDFERIADNVYEMAFEITLRNHKSAPMTVQVNEPIAGIVADAVGVAPVDENGRLGRAVPGACRAGWHVGPQVPRARQLVGVTSVPPR